jgi:hypothetical protein
LVLLLFTFATIHAIACKCDTPPLSKEEAKHYDLIFLGKVDSVGISDTDGICIAYFTAEELYKGNSKQQIPVHFDCKSSCMMSFAKGEEWLIYGTYQRFDVVSVKFCEHSRKQMHAGEQDFYSGQQTFEEENQFLKTNFGLQSFIKDENWNKDQKELRPTNAQPSSSSKIWLLLISFAAMIIIYILTRKKKKEND